MYLQDKISFVGFYMLDMTAKVSCFARAFHFEVNQQHIFADHAAKQLLGEEHFSAAARSMADGITFFDPGFRGTKQQALRRVMDGFISANILGRSAYAEDKLRIKKQLGCSQYIP